MAKWVAEIYASASDFETAIEDVDNTVTIHVLSFMEAGKQKFMLVKSA